MYVFLSRKYFHFAREPGPLSIIQYSLIRRMLNALVSNIYWSWNSSQMSGKKEHYKWCRYTAMILILVLSFLFETYIIPPEIDGHNWRSYFTKIEG